MQNLFPVKLIDFSYHGKNGLLIDAYVRAGMYLNIQTPAGLQSRKQKFYRLLFMPFMIPFSLLDFIKGKKNYAYLTVVFRKEEQ
ncbi:MAG: hypothetical protein N2747_06145 [Chitinophagaceae bacterium]|nr:hypothetical protein [Chitinophagaceae bacterium]